MKPKYPFNPWDIKDPEVDMLNALQAKAIGDQQKMLAAQQMNIGNMSSFEPQANLAPLINLADQWTGSNFAKSYQAPESGKDRLAKMQALEGGLMASQNALTDNQLGQLKTAMAEKKADRQTQLAYLMHKESMDNTLKAAQVKANAQGKGFDKLGFKDEQKIRQDFAKTDEYKKVSSITEFKSALKKYEDLLDEHGIQEFGKESSKLRTAYGDLQIKYKEAAKLGAITGPDMTIIENVIQPATGFAGLLSRGNRGGVDGIKEGISQLRKTVDTDAYLHLDALEKIFPQGAEEQMKSLKGNYEAAGSKSKGRSPAVDTLPWEMSW